jgi:hypothetical protein
MISPDLAPSCSLLMHCGRYFGAPIVQWPWGRSDIDPVTVLQAMVFADANELALQSPMESQTMRWLLI